MLKNLPRNAPPIQVLYEDNHLISVFKEPGILTQGDRSGEPSLLEWTKIWLKQKYSKPGNVFLGLVHRLDRPVSGVILFAKTSKGASRIGKKIRERAFRKVYWAWVEGQPKSPHESLTHYVSWDEKKRKCIPYESEAPRRQQAKLSYRVLRKGSDHTLLEVIPGTGRKHQIRAQLSAIGHPIAGDRKYGSTLPYSGPGIALFAKSITLPHPTQSEDIFIEVEDRLCPFIHQR